MYGRITHFTWLIWYSMYGRITHFTWLIWYSMYGRITHFTWLIWYSMYGRITHFAWFIWYSMYGRITHFTLFIWHSVYGKNYSLYTVYLMSYTVCIPCSCRDLGNTYTVFELTNITNNQCWTPFYLDKDLVCIYIQHDLNSITYYKHAIYWYFCCCMWWC